jgi:hypothetical protein
MNGVSYSKETGQLDGINRPAIGKASESAQAAGKSVNKVRNGPPVAVCNKSNDSAECLSEVNVLDEMKHWIVCRPRRQCKLLGSVGMKLPKDGGGRYAI